MAREPAIIPHATILMTLRMMVSAEGIESALKPQTKHLTEHSWQYKAF